MNNRQTYHQEVIARNVQTIARLEQGILDRRHWDDRIIDSISWLFGHKFFAYCNACFFAAWIVLDCLSDRSFDPYPFPFLTLVVSLEAIFLSIFILITQNRQSLLSERRSHIDLQLNLLNEQETTAQIKLLVTIAEKLGIDVATLPAEMVQETDMNHLADVLDATFREAGLDTNPSAGQ